MVAEKQKLYDETLALIHEFEDELVQNRLNNNPAAMKDWLERLQRAQVRGRALSVWRTHADYTTHRCALLK